MSRTRPLERTVTQPQHLGRLQVTFGAAAAPQGDKIILVTVGIPCDLCKEATSHATYPDQYRRFLRRPYGNILTIMTTCCRMPKSPMATTRRPFVGAHLSENTVNHRHRETRLAEEKTIQGLRM